MQKIRFPNGTVCTAILFTRHKRVDPCFILIDLPPSPNKPFIIEIRYPQEHLFHFTYFHTFITRNCTIYAGTINQSIGSGSICDNDRVRRSVCCCRKRLQQLRTIQMMMRRSRIVTPKSNFTGNLNMASNSIDYRSID